MQFSGGSLISMLVSSIFGRFLLLNAVERSSLKSADATPSGAGQKFYLENNTEKRFISYDRWSESKYHRKKHNRFHTFGGSPRCSSTNNAGAIASSTDLKPHLHRKHKTTLTNYDSYWQCDNLEKDILAAYLQNAEKPWTKEIDPPTFEVNDFIWTIPQLTSNNIQTKKSCT